VKGKPRADGEILFVDPTKRARAVDILIDSVDHAPDDLYGQTPLRGRLLRTITKHDRPDVFRTATGDYWLAELSTPLSWTRDGMTRTIRHLVLAARWEGNSLRPGATLPVGIAYVVDDSLLSSESFEFTQAEYVAIGMAKVSGPSSFWSKVWTRLFGGELTARPPESS
jgi:hypothetical protein